MLLGSAKAAANIIGTDVVSRLRRFMSSSVFSNVSRASHSALEHYGTKILLPRHGGCNQK
jgi:hypothetical protein